MEQRPYDERDSEEIDLSQVLFFFVQNWKRLLLGSVIGLVVGVGTWQIFAPYKAQVVLSNNAFSFISWRSLQKSLPVLAAQLVQSQRSAPDQLNRLSSPSWWAKNVLPTYSVTKADTKDFAAINKDLQDQVGAILNFTVSAEGSSKELAIANVEFIVDFIRQGSTLLQIKSLINSYDLQVLNAETDLQKKILDTNVELKFMHERAKNLEELRQRFPENSAVSSQQVVDLKDSNAKFMPISTQLVAINMDISNTTEALERMHNDQAKTRYLREFVKKAIPMLGEQTNGLLLADQLLKIESDLSATIKPGDTNALQSAISIRASLIHLRTSFSKGLESNLSPQVSRSSPLLPAAGGLLAGGMLMLIFILIRKKLAEIKS